jgi:aspartyl aminopeptidase
MEQQTLIETLQAGVSPFWTVKAGKERLLGAGFTEIRYGETWKLTPGGRYVMEHHGTTLFAFTVGEEMDKIIVSGNSCGDFGQPQTAPQMMLRLAAAHTDYPCLRIKPNADFKTEAYAQVNVEVYGGPILNTWFDRPLGVAGRVMVKGEHVLAPRTILYRSKKPLMIVPNLAIHMNRDVNKGVEINNQIDLMPVVDLIPKEETTTDYFLTFLADELNVAKEDILDFELNTYIMEEPQYVGIKDTMLSAPRLDNQTSVCALLSALIDAGRTDGINLVALFDHEEIGNTSKQGAASILLHDLVRRIVRNLGASEEQTEQVIYEAMLLSVDVAHGLHPNKASKMDITNHPVLGKGFCIKEACSQSYATDAKAISIFRQICDSRQIPYQVFVNRSDVRGGGTLGSVASTLLPVKTVDIGIPLLSMHSARELMGTEDIDALKDAVTAFFITPR